MTEAVTPTMPMRPAVGTRRRWRSAEAILIVLVGVGAFVQCSRGAQDCLQFDRVAIAAGEYWRMFTGNFVHYNWLHLTANFGVFAVLAWMGLGHGPGVLGVIFLSAFTVGAGILLTADVEIYRGVSGVDHALLTWMLVMAATRTSRRAAVGWIGLLLLIVMKSAYEAASGVVLLPTSAPAGIQVVSGTHVVGSVTGLAAAGASLLARRCRRLGRQG